MQNRAQTDEIDTIINHIYQPRTAESERKIEESKLSNQIQDVAIRCAAEDQLINDVYEVMFERYRDAKERERKSFAK